jgi:hypothetical protein
MFHFRVRSPLKSSSATSPQQERAQDLQARYEQNSDKDFTLNNNAKGRSTTTYAPSLRTISMQEAMEAIRKSEAVKTEQIQADPLFTDREKRQQLAKRRPTPLARGRSNYGSLTTMHRHATPRVRQKLISTTTRPPIQASATLNDNDDDKLDICRTGSGGLIMTQRVQHLQTMYELSEEKDFSLNKNVKFKSQAHFAPSLRTISMQEAMENIQKHEKERRERLNSDILLSEREKKEQLMQGIPSQEQQNDILDEVRSTYSGTRPNLAIGRSSYHTIPQISSNWHHHSPRTPALQQIARTSTMVQHDEGHIIHRTGSGGLLMRQSVRGYRASNGKVYDLPTLC